jgi:hypothetical protein
MSEKELGWLGTLRWYLPVCAFTAIVTVSGLWLLFHISYSTRGLPLGWDTPYYLWRIQSASSGIASFLVNMHYYDFLYPTIGSWFSLVGLEPNWFEVLMPFSLWLVATVIIVVIVRRELQDARAILIAVGAGSTWFGLFRLSSDLHANLLGLVLMLCGTWVFLQTQTESRPYRFAFTMMGLAGIILLSSIAHVETTIFISATWLLALGVGLWRGLVGLRRFLAMFVTIFLSLLPGEIIFFLQQQWTAAPLQGRLPAIPVMLPAAWLLYLAPTGLAVLIAVPALYYLRQLYISSRIIALAFSWLSLSFALGLAQYFSQSITPFSERAIILTPTPFVAAIVIPRLGGFRLTSQMKGIALISLIMMGGTTLYFIEIGDRFYSSFISDSAAASLQYLQSSRVLDLRRSIFLFSDSPDHHGYGDHNNAWVGAYLGDHFSYLGRVDFLMAGLETPFTDDQSTQISRIFLGNLPISQVRNMTIVYISDFNYPDPPPILYQGFLQQLNNRIYEVNQIAWSPNLVLIPAYSSVLSSTGGWYSAPRVWAQSGSSLELNSTHPSQTASVSVAFAVPQVANYNITLRIWDGAPATPVSIILDGTSVHRLTYAGTSIAVDAPVFSGGLTKGVHTLTLSVSDEPAIPQYISLDYISIAKLSP